MLRLAALSWAGYLIFLFGICLVGFGFGARLELEEFGCHDTIKALAFGFGLLSAIFWILSASSVNDPREPLSDPTVMWRHFNRAVTAAYANFFAALFSALTVVFAGPPV